VAILIRNSLRADSSADLIFCIVVAYRFAHSTRNRIPVKIAFLHLKVFIIIIEILFFEKLKNPSLKDQLFQGKIKKYLKLIRNSHLHSLNYKKLKIRVKP
jgi:hypothetical protein